MTAPEPPAVWWSPNLGVIEEGGLIGGVRHYAYWDTEWAEWQGVSELPADAVRLVPAAVPVPDDTDEAQRILSWVKAIGIEPTEWQVQAAAALMRGDSVTWPKSAGHRAVGRILDVAELGTDTTPEAHT